MPPRFFLYLTLAAALGLQPGCPANGTVDDHASDDDDAADDDAADDDDVSDDDTADTPRTLDECMDGSGLDFSCDSWVAETAVNGEDAGCLASSLSDSEVFLTFWLADNDPDGTVHVLELRLQDPGWTNTNDGNRWIITLDPPLALADGDQLPPTLTGTAVLDTFTMAAAFSFLEAHFDAVEVTIHTPLTTQDLLDGATLDATVSGTGSDFLVFDGVDDSPEPLGDYEWISDPTGEAYGCIRTAVTLHPLEVGDP